MILGEVIKQLPIFRVLVIHTELQEFIMCFNKVGIEINFAFAFTLANISVLSCFLLFQLVRHDFSINLLAEYLIIIVDLDLLSFQFRLSALIILLVHIRSTMAFNFLFTTFSMLSWWLCRFSLTEVERLIYFQLLYFLLLMMLREQMKLFLLFVIFTLDKVRWSNNTTIITALKLT